MPSDIVFFNPMPVKHSVAVVNKMTTSLQVPLVNIPLSLLALARMVMDDFTVAIINAPVDAPGTLRSGAGIKSGHALELRLRV